MCLFKNRKNKLMIIQQAKYKIGDFVNFRYRDELYFGYIYEIYKDEDDKIIYDIQIGGQCPSVIKNYKEENIIGYKNK